MHIQQKTLQKICLFFNFESGTLVDSKVYFHYAYSKLDCNDNAKNFSECEVTRKRFEMYSPYAILCSMNSRKNCSGKNAISIEDHCYYIYLNKKELSAANMLHICEQQKQQLPDFSNANRLFHFRMLGLVISTFKENPRSILGILGMLFLQSAHYLFSLLFFSIYEVLKDKKDKRNKIQKVTQSNYLTMLYNDLTHDWALNYFSSKTQSYKSSCLTLKVCFK